MGIYDKGNNAVNLGLGGYLELQHGRSTCRLEDTQRDEIAVKEAAINESEDGSKETLRR